MKFLVSLEPGFCFDSVVLTSGKKKTLVLGEQALVFDNCEESWLRNLLVLLTCNWCRELHSEEQEIAESFTAINTAKHIRITSSSTNTPLRCRLQVGTQLLSPKTGQGSPLPGHRTRQERQARPKNSPKFPAAPQLPSVFPAWAESRGRWKLLQRDRGSSFFVALTPSLLLLMYYFSHPLFIWNGWLNPHLILNILGEKFLAAASQSCFFFFSSLPLGNVNTY